jgi:hypothetical protein
MTLASDYLKKEMCLRIDHVESIPIDFLVLKTMLNSKSEKVLGKSDFFLAS